VKLPAYPRYKPSGVEWLGEVPEHWNVKRLKYVAEISTSGVWGEDPETEGDGCPVATTANISPLGDIDVAGMHTRLLSREEFRKGLCRAGDTIVVKSSGSASSVISGKWAMVRTEHGEICFSNFTLRVRPIEGRLNPFFGWSFLSSGIVRAQVRLMVSTTTYPNLQVPEYISFLVPQPPPTEQQAIATFLDRETGRVDQLVAKKWELSWSRPSITSTKVSHACALSTSSHIDSSKTILFSSLLSPTTFTRSPKSTRETWLPFAQGSPEQLRWLTEDSTERIVLTSSSFGGPTERPLLSWITF